ncbi:MAG: type II secretion system protein GspI [Desulfuromonadales bacterium]|nr:MAG: type II secretion system protein GspI [Desulfuromonadales bacterium]
MIALAIIAGVVSTVIAAVNHHLAIISRDRDEGVAILLARQKIDELSTEAELPEKKEGTFAPSRPAYSWELTTTPTEVPGLRKMTLAVAWEGKKRSLALVRYVAK